MSVRRTTMTSGDQKGLYSSSPRAFLQSPSTHKKAEIVVTKFIRFHLTKCRRAFITWKEACLSPRHCLKKPLPYERKTERPVLKREEIFVDGEVEF